MSFYSKYNTSVSSFWGYSLTGVPCWLLNTINNAWNSLLSDIDAAIASFTPFSAAGTSPITVGASPFTYTAGGTGEMIYLYGGSVTSIVKNSVNLGNPNPIWLAAGQSVTITYTLAPTMIKDH